MPRRPTPAAADFRLSSKMVRRKEASKSVTLRKELLAFKVRSRRRRGRLKMMGRMGGRRLHAEGQSPTVLNHVGNEVPSQGCYTTALNGQSREKRGAGVVRMCWRIFRLQEFQVVLTKELAGLIFQV